MTANRSRPNWRWLRPGVGVKRWLLLIFAGLLLLALAGAQLLREIYRDLPPGGPTASLLDVLSLQFLDPWLRVVILAVAGAALFLVCSFSPRSRTDRPRPPPMATTRGPRARQRRR